MASSYFILDNSITKSTIVGSFEFECVIDCCLTPIQQFSS